MFVLSLCPVPDYDYYFFDTSGFLVDFAGFFSAAAFLAIPVAIFVFCWNNFVTAAAATRASLLGLDDRPPRYSEAPIYPEPLPNPEPHQAPEPAFPLLMIVLYVLTGLLTFSLGVLAFEAVQALG